MTPARRRSFPPGAWVPSAYIAEGIPFAMVIWVAGTMFKDLGRSDGEITLGTASIGIVWSLKPLWAPLLDRRRTKKFWVLAMEMALAVLLGVTAVALRTARATSTSFSLCSGCWRSPRRRRTSASTASTSPRSTDARRPRGLASRACAGTSGASSRRRPSSGSREPEERWPRRRGPPGRSRWRERGGHGRCSPSTTRSSCRRARSPMRPRAGAEVVRDVRRRGARVLPQEVDMGDARVRLPLPRRAKGSSSSRRRSSCRPARRGEASASLWPKRRSSTGR